MRLVVRYLFVTGFQRYDKRSRSQLHRRPRHIYVYPLVNRNGIYLLFRLVCTRFEGSFATWSAVVFEEFERSRFQSYSSMD